MKKEKLIISIFVLVFFMLFMLASASAVVTIDCYNNANCDDDNASTYDECINPGTVTSDCIHEDIKCFSDSYCGANGYEDEKFCFIDDLFRDFTTFVCVNPGQVDSYCNINTEPIFYRDCGEDYCENYGENYCIDRSIYHNKTCYDRGCSGSNCFNHSSIQKELVKECELGCLNGACVECSQDSDCNEDYFSEPYCEGDNRNEIFHDLTDYSCINKKCVMDIQNIRIKDCGSNTCKKAYESKYCKGNEVYQNRTCNEQGCSAGQCYNNTIVEEKLIARCSINQKCFNGSCETNDCFKDSDCDDGNSYTLDSCNITNGIGKCLNSPIKCFKDLDCGKDKFIGGQFCQDDKNIFKNFSTSKCINPGTIESACNNTIMAKFLTGCGENFYSESYCRNNNVYWNFNNNSCIGNGICSKKITQQLKETCQKGCYDGYCKECTNDRECSDKNSCSEYSALYCKENSVYKRRTCSEYSCQQYACLKETKEEEILVLGCSDNQYCETGACINVEEIFPFDIIAPVQDSTYPKKVNFEIKVNESIVPGKIKYADESLNTSLRLLCGNFKDNFCQKKITFKRGYHIVKLELTAKNGTVYTQKIGFTVN